MTGNLSDKIRFYKEHSAEIIIILLGLAVSALLLVTPHRGNLPLGITVLFPFGMSLTMGLILAFKLNGKLTLSQYFRNGFSLVGTCAFAVIVYHNLELPIVLAPAVALVIIIFSRSWFGFWLVVLIGVYLSAMIYFTPNIDLAITMRALGSYFSVIILIGYLVKVHESETSVKQALLDANQKLETAVEKLEKNQRKLQQEKEKAILANDAKSIFLSNMSHEIRTPLNGLTGTLELLKDENLSPTAKDILDRAVYSSELLLSLINDILDLSKLEAGKFEVESTSFDLRKLAQQLNQEYTHYAKGKKITFELTCRIEHQYWRGDLIRIRQILLNLISNAFKFTEKGLITVSIEECEHDTDLILFNVCDSGIGMDDNMLSRIFQRFEQADQTNTRQYGGTGLGLSITKYLVELMNGKIEVTSEVNIGTCFKVSLPLIRTFEAPLSNKQEFAPPNLTGKKILIAEDNQVNQFVVKGLLKPTGALLTFTKNGKEAVEQCQAMPFDLLIMDIQMPIMDGLEACQEIRAFNTKVPVVALTANAYEEDQKNYLENGFTGCLTKPVNKSDLYSALSKYLEV
ncbi:MAG: response regulator [Gammaproteobacteria bacterium]|nr:response regulator [Gammaproteobacteria bacterium]